MLLNSLISTPISGSSDCLLARRNLTPRYWHLKTTLQPNGTKLSISSQICIADLFLSIDSNRVETFSVSSIVIDWKYRAIAIGDWYRLNRWISDIDFYRSRTTPACLVSLSRRNLFAPHRGGEELQSSIWTCHEDDASRFGPAIKG